MSREIWDHRASVELGLKRFCSKVLWGEQRDLDDKFALWKVLSFRGVNGDNLNAAGCRTESVQLSQDLLITNDSIQVKCILTGQNSGMCPYGRDGTDYVILFTFFFSFCLLCFSSTPSFFFVISRF